MTSKAAPFFRDALTSDVLGALDFAESVYRGMQRTDAAQLGMTDAEYGVVRGSLEAAYHALCAARIALEGTTGDD